MADATIGCAAGRARVMQPADASGISVHKADNTALKILFAINIVGEEKRIAGLAEAKFRS
jgi:hypothetical protein